MNERHLSPTLILRRALAVALFCGTVLPAGLVAQAKAGFHPVTRTPGGDTLPVTPGERIRVYAEVERVGVVIAQRADTLVLAACSTCVPEHVLHQSIDHLDVSMGRKSSPSRTLAGALFGAAVGSVAGYALIGHSNRHCHGDTCSLNYLGVPLYGAGGLVVGAIAGSRWRVEQWKPVPTSSQR